jgi:hypothetical protein
MRGEYRTPIYTLKAQKAYRERNAELLAEKARERYYKNRVVILQRMKDRRDMLKENEAEIIMITVS